MRRIASSPSAPRSPCRRSASDFFPMSARRSCWRARPGITGTHLALTGSRIGAADAIYCGLADIHIAAARLAELPAALADCRTAQRCARSRLGEMSVPPAPGSWPRRGLDRPLLWRRTRRRHCRAPARCDAEEARAALETMRKASPTSLKITLRNIRSAVSFKRVEESFQQDYRIALACIAGHDFIEGIRAAIVDKDRNPVWRPDKLEDVTPDIVERHFQIRRRAGTEIRQIERGERNVDNRLYRSRQYGRADGRQSGQIGRARPGLRRRAGVARGRRPATACRSSPTPERRSKTPTSSSPCCRAASTSCRSGTTSCRGRGRARCSSTARPSMWRARARRTRWRPRAASPRSTPRSPAASAAPRRRR